MKKNIHLLFLAVSVLILGLYISSIEPAVDKPIVLAGFSLLVFLNLFLALYAGLRQAGIGRIAYLISFIIGLALIYLIALSSLNSLGLVDVGIVVVSVTLLVAFVVGPLRRRRKS
jgi:hypothetical protein